jgi:hypothetical protein
MAEGPSPVSRRDPLTPVTRKERLYLLAVSMIGIAIVKTGLVPSKIATFGIELDKPNRTALLLLLGLVTLYFLAAFVIYAASDFMEWRERLVRESISAEEPFPQLFGFVGGIADLLRLVFEFVLPVFVGAYATYVLLSPALF